MVGSGEPRKPRAFMRVVILMLALFVAWYLITKVLALFDYSIGRKTATTLTIRSGFESVQVSLQGGEFQRAETNLRLYEGDAVSVRGNADTLLTFFDGSRLRLDRDSDILIGGSESVQNGSSSITVAVRSGRIWLSTPTEKSYSGTIIRTITTKNFSARIPAGTHAMISAAMVTVLRAGGAGVLMTIAGATEKNIIVGEGQYLGLSDEAKTVIAEGGDPYEFRDPLTSQMLKDDFLMTSYALLSQNTSPKSGSGGAVFDNLGGIDLTLSSPENHADSKTKTLTVSGKVSNRVALVLVNGQSVPLKKDRTFSVDMNLGKEVTATLHVEAQDMQGITLSAIDRIITNSFKATVDPVRFKSPVASGGTLTTGQREVEITGEAPAGAAAIVMNEYKLQLFKPGSRTWSYLASTALGNMVVGKNTFTVTVLDSEGNKSPPRSIFIVFSTSGPANATGSTDLPPLKQNAPLAPGSLSVTGPAAGTDTTTDQKEIILEGITSPDTSSISVNGYTLSLYLAGKTTWNYIASTELSTMKRGRNVYRIVSRNKDGEILDVLEYTINFRP